MTQSEADLLKRLVKMDLPITSKARIVQIGDPRWKWRIVDESILYMVGIGSAVTVEECLKAKDLGIVYPTFDPTLMEIVRVQ